jgi:dihydrofolate reductase
VVGRRVFDYTNGWNGRHPFGVPVFVVTHSVPEGWPRADAPFTIVTDGVESTIAQAREVAGDKSVGVAGPSIIQQCINAGLLDELTIELVPVLLGEGIPFFGNLSNPPVMFENPRVIEGDPSDCIARALATQNREARQCGAGEPWPPTHPTSTVVPSGSDTIEPCRVYVFCWLVAEVQST